MSVILFSTNSDIVDEINISFISLFKVEVFKNIDLEYIIKNKNQISLLIIDTSTFPLKRYNFNDLELKFDFPIIFIGNNQKKLVKSFKNYISDFVDFPLSDIHKNRIKNYYIIYTNKLKNTEIESINLEKEKIYNAHKNQLDNMVKVNFSGENLFKSIFELDKKKYKVWTIFELKFNEIFPSFYQNIYKINESITQNEMRILSCLKVNLSYNEISEFSGISPKAVHQAIYRLKKKLSINSKNGLIELVRNI